VNYRIPEPLGLEADRLVLADSVILTLGSPLPAAQVLWTVEREWGRGTRVADGPVTLPVDSAGVQITARLALPGGRLGPLRTGRIRRATLRPAPAVDPERLAPGLAYAYYERRVRRAAVLGDWVPSARDVVQAVGLKGTERAVDFGIRLTGFLRVPEDAVYEFAMLSDDGSVLRVGREVVIDHDGPHGARVATGAMALAAGHHPFEVLYFQGDGDRALDVRIRVGGTDAWGPIPADWLYRER